LCIALFWFWYTRKASEGGIFLEQALAVGADVAALVRARALYAAADLAWSVEGNNDRADALTRESQTLYRELGDRHGIAISLLMLAAIAWTRSQYAVARSQLEEAEALFKEVGDTWNRGMCLTQLARIATAQGDYAHARALLEEGLGLYRAIGDQVRIGWVRFLQAEMLFLSGSNPAEVQALAEQSLALMREISDNWMTFGTLRLLGQLRLLQGEQVLARELFEACLATCKEVGVQHEIAVTQIGLARVLALQGEVARARALYQESLALVREVSYTAEFLAPCLEGLAAVVVSQGEPVWAVRLYGAAEALRETNGTPLSPVYRADYEQAVAAVRRELGAEVFAAAWAQGRAIPPEQVIDEALKPYHHP
jgi:tetratricopeptide (TPR) repeat protein